eukprot:m.45609 g.45609  ORF g.45609 m.45609 type:complete len:76 (-) comp10273_c0_seq4:34-261(-)
MLISQSCLYGLCVGHAAGVAAYMVSQSMKSGNTTTVQNLNVTMLQEVLRKEKAILTMQALVVDDRALTCYKQEIY